MNQLSHEAQKYLSRLEIHGILPGLDTVRRVLAAFDNPQNQPCILIAGTNGKGSCAAMLQSILTASGKRTGLYTSPHLVAVNERIKIGRVEISGDELSTILQEIETKNRELLADKAIEREPTYFEVLTVAAFLYFKRHACEVNVLEIGMGGTFDATNVAEPFLSMITPISLDHQEYLGDSLVKIAKEKAGIMRRSVPVICSQQTPEVEIELRRQASDVGAPIEFDDLTIDHRAHDMGSYLLKRQSDTAPWIILPLPGIHQVWNASLVLIACRHLPGIGPDAEKKGIEACVWPGRLEKVSDQPLIFLDGCHNTTGAETAAEFVRSITRRPRILVFGCMKDKNIKEIGETLFPVFDTIILTTAVPGSRTASPGEIRSATSHINRPVSIEPDLTRVIGPGWSWLFAEFPLPPDALLFIAGSLYLVGEAKRLAHPSS